MSGKELRNIHLGETVSVSERLCERGAQSEEIFRCRRCQGSVPVAEQPGQLANSTGYTWHP